MCLRGSADYADVMCFEIRGRFEMRGSLSNQLTEYTVVTGTGLRFICIDRLDAPSSDLHRLDCAGCRLWRSEMR